MNSQLDLSDLRKKIDYSQSPYRVVNREQIQYVGRLGDEMDTQSQVDGVGRNVYKIDGVEVLTTDYVSKQLDEIIGLTPKQQRAVKAASGDAGVKDFRNYLATANSIVKPSKVALVATPETRTVTSVIPLKDGLISSDSFFDFAEIFMEKAGLTPTFHRSAFDISNGVTLYMDSDNPIVRQFAPNEDFLVNSYYLSWNLGQIELGRYYERLICTNGQTETVKTKEARIHSLQTAQISAMLNIPNNREMLESAYRRFETKALAAMETRASLAELSKTSKMLSGYMVDSKQVKEIAPFEDELQRYVNFGYNVEKHPLNQMKASMTYWELYNSVTAFASHTEGWDDADNRRGNIQGEAFSMLMKERDIKAYIDAFPAIS